MAKSNRHNLYTPIKIAYNRQSEFSWSRIYTAAGILQFRWLPADPIDSYGWGYGRQVVFCIYYPNQLVVFLYFSYIIKNYNLYKFAYWYINIYYLKETVYYKILNHLLEYLLKSIVLIYPFRQLSSTSLENQPLRLLHYYLKQKKDCPLSCTILLSQPTFIHCFHPAPSVIVNYQHTIKIPILKFLKHSYFLYWCTSYNLINIGYHPDNQQNKIIYIPSHNPSPSK